MTSQPPDDAVRASALELLASGNSLASVAHVFGVPVATLRAWAQQAAPARPSRPIAIDAAPPRPATFPKTATYRMGVMGRFAAFALALMLLCGPVFAWPFVFDGAASPGGAFVFLVSTAALATLAVCAVRLALNARFELDPRGITGYRLGAGQTLALARIEAMTATRQPKSTSYTVVLHAMPGARSLTIHPEEQHLRDADLYAWLTSIPHRGGGGLRRPADPSTTPAWLRVIGVLMALYVLGMGIFLGRGPIDEARSMMDGYPPLEQLSVTEGTVASIGYCHRGGRHARDWLPVAIATTAGPVSESVDCAVERPLRAQPAPQHIAVWRDRREFSDGGVREIDVDGHAVQSYADYIARKRRFAPAGFVGELMLISAMVLFVAGFLLSSRDDG